MNPAEPSSLFASDQRPLVAFDWSLKGVHVTRDGKAVDRLPDIDALLDTLDAPTKLVAEATFESWDPKRRQTVLTRLRDEGHELYVYRPLHTSRRRPKGKAKSDENDATVIYSIAADGRFHLYPAPADTNVDWVRRRTRANREYRRVRLAGEKPALAEQVEEILGSYKELEGDTRSVLGNGKQYSTTLLAAVWFATTWARSRDEFERMLGLSGSSYPSLLRSEIHTHVWRHAKKRGVTWQQFRRELRKLHRTLREHGVEPIEDRNVLPSADELAEALLDAGFPVTADAAERAVTALRS